MTKKLQAIFLYLIAFTIPFNIRHIFNFTEVQNIDGFREHLTISLYFFDFLFISLLFFFLIANRKKIFTKKTFFRTFQTPLIYLIIFLLLSPFITQTSNRPIAWYQIIKLLEFIVLFIIARNTLRQHTVLTYFKFAIFTSGFIQATIALLQFITQKSIGLKWLGESLIGPNILGVAKFSFENEKLIRAYGTFPHPNMLGIFLLLSIASGLSLLLSKKNLFIKLRWQYRLIFFGELIFMYLGILLTYSRSIILLTAVISFILLYSKRDFINASYKKICKKLHIPFFLQTSVAIIIIFTSMFTVYNLLAPRLCLHCPEDKSIALRAEYLKTSNLIISQYPLTGIGLGNFTTKLKHLNSNLSSWNVQPVHNLYLLVASELGLLGLILFLTTIFFYSAKNLRPHYLAKHPLDLFFAIVLLAGFFDHYFWTLPQGQLIFWLSLAIVSISKTTKIDSPKYHFKPMLKNIRQLLKELS